MQTAAMWKARQVCATATPRRHLRHHHPLQRPGHHQRPHLFQHLHRLPRQPQFRHPRPYQRLFQRPHLRRRNA